MWETCVRFPGWENPLEKEMATHFCTLAWRIPWTEERDRLLHPWDFSGKSTGVGCHCLLLVWKLFISPSILNEILPRSSNLGYRFFPFSNLNISCYCLLACRVSAERSAVKHTKFPLYVTCCFSLAAFNILSFFFFFKSSFLFFYFFLIIIFLFYFIFFYFLVFYFLNFKIFNSYIHSQTWTPLPPPSP